MFSDICLFDEKASKNFRFSKLNFVLGPSESGKTFFLEWLSDCFSGKNKQITIDGLHVRPDDYNVIYIPSKENVASHLKLSSKSLVRKVIEEAKYSNEFQDALEEVKTNLYTLEKEVANVLSQVLPGSSLRAKSIEEPLQIFMDAMSISMDADSSSVARKSLFALTTQLTRYTNKRSVILIDDFDNDFTEEGILGFMEDVNNAEATFILSSRRALPQQIITDDARIICCREKSIIELPRLKEMLVDAIEGQPEYTSFEEYMLGKGYNKSSGIEDSYLELIKEDQAANLLRIITSNQPVLCHRREPGKICIVPRSENEEKVYLRVFELLGIPKSVD